MCSVPYKGKEKYKVKVFVYVKIKKRGTFFKLTTLAFRNPRGATGAALRVTPFCCSHCRFSKKRGTLFFENSSFVQSCKFVTDYRTFMKDFLKVVDFVHYLKAEGYDMVTFKKVRDVDKP